MCMWEIKDSIGKDTLLMGLLKFKNFGILFTILTFGYVRIIGAFISYRKANNLKLDMIYFHLKSLKSHSIIKHSGKFRIKT